MNMASTKTNAAAIPTWAHPDTTTQQVAVFSLTSRKGREGWGEEANFIRYPSPALRAPSPLGRERDGVRGAFDRGNLHVPKFLHGYIATHFAYAPALVRRSPAFAPLHRFINCLMAEASDR